MTQTNTQEVAFFTPVELAELNAIDGGALAIGPEPIVHDPIVQRIWGIPIVNHHPGNPPIHPLNSDK
jgi:hypothetical protein